MKRSLEAAGFGLLAAGAVPRAPLPTRSGPCELAELDRGTVETSAGAVEYCEWGEGLPLLLVHGVVGGCDVPPSWRALIPSGYRTICSTRGPLTHALNMLGPGRTL